MRLRHGPGFGAHRRSAHAATLLASSGAGLLGKTVKALAHGTLQEKPQDSITDESSIKHAPKIFTETCKIDWNKPVAEVYNLIRGLSPHPAAFTFFDGKTLKIFKALKKETAPAHQPGEWDTDQKSYLRFACTDGYIDVLELQLEGKKKMHTEDFLRGYRFLP